MLTTLVFRISILLLLISCSAPNKSQSQSENLNHEKLNISSREKAENTIVFLTLHMRITDSVKDTYQFTVTNIIFATGILKQSPFQNHVAIEPYYLYCEITDDSKKRLDLIKVQNPLLKVFEYSPDKEKLEKKLFVNDTGELNLRFQFLKDSKYLTIYKPQSDLLTLKKIFHVQL
jgi:hypothetical protein